MSFVFTLTYWKPVRDNIGSSSTDRAGKKMIEHNANYRSCKSKKCKTLCNMTFHL